MAELLDRARQLLAAGPYDARPAELAAVHAAIYPERDAVCETCRHELGRAYYAIQRWAGQQADSSTSISSNVKKSTTARFKSDTTIYTPHGLGVAYSNTNLTDKAARDILKNDPNAASLFDVLPSEADDDEQDLTPAQASAEQAADQAQQPTQALPAGFDYKALASAMVDELERRASEAAEKRLASATRPAEAEQPNLTASAGGAGDSSTELKTETLNNGVDVTTGKTETAEDDSHDDEKPVRLSRMNKEQLVAAYTTEVGTAPAENLTNDELREAIATAREAKA